MENMGNDLFDEKIVSVAEIIALRLVSAGSDETNFKILTMVPSDVRKIMEETGLTKVPVNVRLNILAKYGLVQRQKGVGTVTAGPQLAMFMRAYEKLKEKVGENVYKYILSMDLNDRALSRALAKG